MAKNNGRWIFQVKEWHTCICVACWQKRRLLFWVQWPWARAICGWYLTKDMSNSFKRHVPNYRVRWKKRMNSISSSCISLLTLFTPPSSLLVLVHTRSPYILTGKQGYHIPRKNEWISASSKFKVGHTHFLSLYRPVFELAQPSSISLSIWFFPFPFFQLYCDHCTHIPWQEKALWEACEFIVLTRLPCTL